MEYDLAKVQYLLRKMKEAGFKCPCQHWCRRTSALHLAVSQLDGPIVNILLKGDFSCRLRDKNGNTPVHTLLSMRGEIDRVLPYMISHVRAQINIPNNANQTPFMLAAMNDRIELMKSCIEMDVKNGEKQIVHQDNINFTFQLALRKNKLEVANMLLPYVTGLRKEDSKQLKALLAGKQIDIKLPDFNALFFAPTSREPLSVDETIPLLPKRERVDYSDAIFRDSKASTWRVM
jgi:ankyrin repeat protein